jgi:hypothetical protein
MIIRPLVRLKRLESIIAYGYGLLGCLVVSGVR